MKVEAVSNVGFRSCNYTFGEKQKQQDDVIVQGPSSSNSLIKKVPVIVLLAMNPATLNSAIPVIPETDNPDKIVMLAPEQKADMNSVYVINPSVEQASQQSAPPYGWARFNGAACNIKFSMPAKGNGANYHMLFTAMKSDKEHIDDIYFVKDGSVGSVNAGDHPPKVQTLIYHNLGENSFCSVITLEDILGSDRKSNGSTLREIMLDDASAQKIIDLVSGDTKWKNNTHIQIKETFDATISKPKTTLY